MELTDQQERRKAIEHVNGPMEVQAPHGTGKTALVLDRYTHLVKNQIAWAMEIVLLTYTRRAAAEMRERLQLQLGEDTEGISIYTIHSFARSILATKSAKKPFKLYDPNQSFRVLRKAMADEGLSEAAWPPALIAELIADAKERGLTPEAFITVRDSLAQRVVAQVYARYQALLIKEHALDFSDLVMKAVDLLQNDEALREQILLRCRFVMVDEWQDTSLGQYQLIRLLAGQEHNLFVVGAGEPQSIYEWRQANYKRLSEKFYEDFPEATQITLRDNFRSTKQIVQAAASLFDPQRYPDLDLVAQRGSGSPIRDVRVQNEFEEAEFVAAEVLKLGRQGIPLSEMAVLYRTNRQATMLEHEFMRRQVPYVMTQRQRIYHRREVRDILAYLTLATSDDDSMLHLVLNTPERGIGPVSVRAIKGNHPYISRKRIREAIAQGEALGLRPKAIDGLRNLEALLDELRQKAIGLKPSDLIALVMERTGYRAWLSDSLDGEARLNSIRDLLKEADDYPKTEEFLQVVRQRIEDDLERPDDEGATLLTIHSSKGLQFQAVFVVGMEEGLLPYVRSIEHGTESGERRLAHVAMSRAKNWLYLVSAQSRELNGRRIYPRPSRYLRSLPAEIVVRQRLPLVATS